ncbi:MAG: helix-turn-helix domain-containing protein [Acidobacteria bacterium]|nr:helix-turn-helix domain-containing protein [Acidobacteriota bacterium]
MNHALRSIQNHPPVGLPIPWNRENIISVDLRQGETLADLWIRLKQEEKRRLVFGNAKEAADILGVKPGRAYGLFNEGKIAALKVSGRLYFYLPSLREFIANGDDLGPLEQLPKRRPPFPPLPPAVAAMAVHP